MHYLRRFEGMFTVYKGPFSFFKIVLDSSVSLDLFEQFFRRPGRADNSKNNSSNSFTSTLSTWVAVHLSKARAT